MTLEVDLVSEVTRRIPLPIDGLEITALLESLGITDELARRRYGAADTFDLAEKVLISARMSVPVAISEPDNAARPAGRGTVRRRPSTPTRAWGFGTAVALAVVVLALQIVGAPMIVPASGVGDGTTSEPIAIAAAPPPPATTLPPAREHDPSDAYSPALVAVPNLESASTGPRTIQPQPRIILDELFDEYSRGWPNDMNATAWLTRDGYRFSARLASRFVAVGARLGRPVRDVIVTAIFRKVGGPPGGGYGVIVRDEGPGPRDGLSQSGRYYVLAAGDVGDVGIWLREHDRWVDLVPWTRSSLVRLDSEPNEVQAQAIGARLTLLVNGTVVADVNDATVSSGHVGIFVGGDGNEVLLERFVATIPAE
jgi:hypothetical protein